MLPFVRLTASAAHFQLKHLTLLLMCTQYTPPNMTTSKTAIIKCGVKAQEFNLNNELHPNTTISKLYIPEEADVTFFKNRYPQAEIVDQKEFILEDELIDHVIIFTPEVNDMPLIQAVLQSGKNVQIMHN